MIAAAAMLDNRHRIIIGVDDSPEILGLLKLVLIDAGYHFFGCASGTECLQLVTRVAPRLILMDIEMPHMDGFKTCRGLRNMMPLDSVPIAFITVRKTREDVRQGLLAGGNDFISKPFQRDRLLERAQHWTTRRLETRMRAGGTK
jgi:CheY-like chemotaxis protein